MPYEPKTDRKRGVIWRTLRAEALKRSQLTPMDVADMVGGKEKASNNLLCLAKNGELAVLQKGQAGTGRMPIYRATSKLRAPHLTNKHIKPEERRPMSESVTLFKGIS